MQVEPSAGKRRHDAPSDAECAAAQERIKRLRIGAMPWCAALPLFSSPCASRLRGSPCISGNRVRSAQHSQMSQPPLSTVPPHPGLARTWAGAQPMQQQPAYSPPATQPVPFHIPLAPQQHFGFI